MNDLPTAPHVYHSRCMRSAADEAGPTSWHVFARSDDEARRRWRVDCCARLRESGYSPDDPVELFREQGGARVDGGYLRALAA